MRELTEKEDAVLRTNRCPCCLALHLTLGPQGGMSANMYCPNGECDARFNVSPMWSEFIRAPKGGMRDDFIAEQPKEPKRGRWWRWRHRKSAMTKAT